MNHQQRSSYLPVADYQLHLRELVPLKPSAGPVLCLHGAIGNSRIFYTEHGKGLACFLADQGFLVYCADFAGRGLSKPHVSSGFNQSQHQQICQDIPALIDALYQRHQQKIHLIGHSWGGVVLLAALARRPDLLDKVASMVTFGSKRRITVNSLKKRLQIDLVWNRLAPYLAARYGYLPAKRFRLGADDEPQQHLLDTVCWIKQLAFTDCSDAFDYAKAAQQLSWPPAWFFAGSADKVLGHPQDVRLLMQESGLAAARFTELGRRNGDKIDYGHIDMLTHPAARPGHFAALASWLRQLD